MIILKENTYGWKEVVGKKVVPAKQELSYHGDLCGFSVRGSELIRCGQDPFDIDPQFLYFFEPNEFELIEPKLQNCTDLSIGKGWEGYYEQKPIKKSNFR